MVIPSFFDPELEKEGWYLNTQKQWVYKDAKAGSPGKGVGSWQSNYPPPQGFLISKHSALAVLGSF